eukprot:TRINITY_DN48628_c0_g1_i1.p1 TRINITY_DN48628_c0_g1~~TRINITY_DN48628_c0_g1_i1.p1  ORF type:complete len:199 (+),score=49.74 TRINITY_DN48628_c0_g1_i1:40-636(+)
MANTMQQMVGERAHQTRAKKKTMKRGVVASAPRMTLANENRSLLSDIVTTGQTLIRNEELWCATTALSYIGWCKTAQMGQQGVERERKRWMKENNITYNDLRKYLDNNFEQYQPVMTLKELTLTSGKIVAKDSIGYVTKLPEKGQGPEVKFKVKGEGKESREIYRTELGDCEAVQNLIQWGWRPPRVDADTESETDDE